MLWLIRSDPSLELEQSVVLEGRSVCDDLLEEALKTVVLHPSYVSLGGSLISRGNQDRQKGLYQ